MARNCSHFGSIFVATALSVAPAQAVVILHTTFQNNGGMIDPPDEANVNLGYTGHRNLSNQNQFKASGETDDGCTATFLGKDTTGNSYFLSAAHCRNNGTLTGFGFTDWQGTYHESTTATATYTNHTGWSDVGQSGIDLQMITVSSQFNMVIPDWVKPTLYSGTAEQGKHLTWVGYGTRGVGGGPGTTGQDAALYGSGRAAGTNIIDIVGTNTLNFDFDAPATAHDQFEGHLSSGDSGGSGWIQQNGQWLIAGVVSESGDETYGNDNVMTRVSSSEAFIKSVYADALFAVPEPSSSLLLGIGSLVLILRMKKVSYPCRQLLQTSTVIVCAFEV